MKELDHVFRLASNGFNSEAYAEVVRLRNDDSTDLSLVWALKPLERALAVHAIADKGWANRTLAKGLEAFKNKPSEEVTE